MKAFWWFYENKVAGMARPGFNHCHWMDLPFEEAMIMGWLGRYSSSRISLNHFYEHLEMYVPKVAGFYKIEHNQIPKYLERFRDRAVFERALHQLKVRSQFMARAHIEDNELHLETNKNQLQREITHLRNKGIQRIVSLTEDHHDTDDLAEHFDLHHISIMDMGAPTLEQVHELVRIFEDIHAKGERLAVHCLAGIGRTSTMLMAAEIMRGRSLPDLLDHVKKQNPTYVFVGSQAEFIRSLANS